jgi:hypothetical protein
VVARASGSNNAKPVGGLDTTGLGIANSQTPRVNGHILNSEKGFPFTDSTGFARAIHRTLKEIVVEDHSGHGLRVTAACNLKKAGYTNAQVMAVTGHTETKTL